MAPGNCTGPGYPVDLWTKCCMVLCRLCRWALQRFDSDWTCNLVVGLRCCSLALLSIHPKSKSSFSTARDLRWSTTRHQLSTYCPCWSRRWGCTKLVAQVNDDSPRVTAVIELVRRSWRRLWCENLWLWAMACRPAKGWTSWRKRKQFGPIVIHFSVTCLWHTCRHMCPCVYMFCRVSEFLVE